jgi:hypothetical protein
MKNLIIFLKIQVILVFLLSSCPTFAQSKGIVFDNMINPDPELHNLSCVSGIDNSNIFAGGEHGTLLKYNGSIWSLIPTSTSVGIGDICVIAPNNVLMVGPSGAVLKYNGTTVVPVNIGATDDLCKIIAFSASDIYIIGNHGAFYHYNGTNWTKINNSYSNFFICGIFGVSGSDLYLVGEDNYSPYTARLLHYDGTSISEAKSIVGGFFASIWSPDNNLFYITGDNIYCYNKSAGTINPVHNGGAYFYSLFGFDGSDMLAAGSPGIVHYDGSNWSIISSYGGINGIYSPVNDKANVYCVGTDGHIFHLDLVSGIEEKKLSADFNIYPNPATNMVNLDIKTTQKVNISIYNLAGQKIINVLDGFVGNESVKIETNLLPAGVYLIRVETAEGSASKKLVVHK